MIDRSEPSLRQALENLIDRHPAKNPDSPTLATLFDRLGQAYTDLISGNGADNRATTIEYSKKALTIQGNLKLNRLNTLVRLVNLYRHLSNWNESEALYHQCLDTSEDLQMNRHIAETNWDLTQLDLDRGDEPQAQRITRSRTIYLSNSVQKEI